MQLILTQSITEGIQMKMSAQTETPGNENLSEVKEINQAFKIDEATIAALEKSLSNDLPPSDISNKIVIMKEKSRDNISNTNGDENYCIPQDNLVENTNSMVSQTITNGTSCAQDTPESECITQNLEITNVHKPSQNKTVDSEHCIQNNTEIPQHFTKIKSGLVCSVEPLLENSMILLDESKDNLLNINTNTVSCLDSDIIPDISVQSKVINEASRVIKDIIDSDPEKLKDESKHTELTSTDANEYSDDIEMGNEILKLSEEPSSILTNNGSNSIVEQNCLDSEDVTMDEIDSSDNKKQPTEDTAPVKMDIEILPANQIDENIMSQESQAAKCSETNKEESLSLQTDENIVSLENDDSKNVEMDKKQSLSAQIKENVTSLEKVDPEPMEEDKTYLPRNNGENEMSLNSDTLEVNKTDKDVLSSFQTDENTFSAKSEAKNSVEVQQTLSSDQPTTKHETKEETLTTVSESISTTVFAATDNTEKLKDHTLEINVNKLQETDTVLVLEAKTTTVFDATDNTEKLKEHPSEINYKNIQETNTSLVSESAPPIVSVASANTEKLKEQTSEVKLNSILKTDTQHVNSISMCNKDKIIGDCKSLGKDSMEVDDIETNDVKENLKDVSNNGDSPNEVLSILQVTKSEVTSETGAEQKVTEDLVEQNEIILENKVVANLLTENLNLDTIGITSKTDAEQKVTEDLVDETLEKKVILENKFNENILTENLNLDTNVITTVESKNSADSMEKEVKDLTTKDEENIEITDEDDVKIVDLDDDTTKIQQKINSPEQEPKTLPVVCTLSNTLDILSDDEEEASNAATSIPQPSPAEKQCIDLDDDDDIMLIEEDTNFKDKTEMSCNKEDTEPKKNHKVDVVDVGGSEEQATVITNLAPNIDEKDSSTENVSAMEVDSVPDTENKPEAENKKSEKPLLPQNFLKTAKKNLASMTRHELEDFCILRIVESIVDRSNLSDIKTKMKTMAQNLEDYKKRATMMTKQNRDLQVVLKSVQEEQKKRLNTPVIPLKITRSVGMQVLMNDKLDPRRKAPIPNPVQATPTPGPSGRPIRGTTQNVKQIKPPASPVNIPVPRKVPVNNSPSKPVTNTLSNSVGNKSASPIGVRIPSPVQKAPEKRTHTRMQATSVTVDLTDDEPPAKISNKTAPLQPVRVVPQQNLLAPPRQFPPITNNARKVYIPISGPGNQQIRPGQTYVMKNMSSPAPKPAQRMPIPRPQPQNLRPKQPTNRHPAPLPESMKQYTPSTWKALPPAPDLKLSKVENGIVISWKIDGYPEGDYETIASYQLYAYQETTAPPCTALWKKIGDVKALPLPMACTLTQFMAGFKYYFAVRAVDVKCRLGPFSLPGSILLLNKV